MPSQTRSSPFGMARKRAPGVSSSPTSDLGDSAPSPSPSPSPILLHRDLQSPVVKQKRSFFKRRPSKNSHHKPASDSADVSVLAPGIELDEYSPPRVYDSPLHSSPRSCDNDDSSELVDAASSLLATLHGRMRPKSPAPFSPTVISPTPRGSEEQSKAGDGHAVHGAARAFGFLPKLLGASPSRDSSSLAPPQTLRPSLSRLKLRPPPDPEPAFEVRGMAFPIPPSHTPPSKLSLELAATLESPTSSISAGSTAYDRPEREPVLVTPTRKSTVDSDLWGAAGETLRLADASPPASTEDGGARKPGITIGTDVSRSPRERMPTPHSRAFPAGVRDAPLKDLPPLPVPPPCPPPAMPLPPTPLEMQRALAEERLRAARLADELQRVTEERDALARRLHNACGGDSRKKTGGGAVFDYDHAIAHMVRSPGADSVFSSADEGELDDLFFRGSRSATPDADEPFPPTPQNTSPPRFGAPVVPSEQRAPKTVYSQSFVELPGNSEPGNMERPAAKLAPLTAKSTRGFVRHGSSRSISSLPAPPPPAVATRSGLSRPSTAGAGSTPPVRPRRVGLVHRK